MKKMNKKGFTIVELVIVIAVIAILAAVLIPTFSGVVSKANSSAALQEATSVMKSTLAMSDKGTLSDGTIFAVGDKSGVNYEFTYTGNKITETAQTNDKYTALTAIDGGKTYTGDTVNYDRIIISTDAVTSSAWSTDADKVKGIIKAVFGSSTDIGTLTSAPSGDSNAKYGLSVTQGSTTVVIGVYVNSDYPTDVVTFVPATKSTTTTKTNPNVTAPEPASDLKTNSATSAALLSTEGATTGGEIQYAVTADSVETAPESGWSTTAPTVADIPGTIDVGWYKIWYKVVGDSTYNDVAATSIQVYIGAE